MLVRLNLIRIPSTNFFTFKKKIRLLENADVLNDFCLIPSILWETQHYTLAGFLHLYDARANHSEVTRPEMKSIVKYYMFKTHLI